MVFEYSHMFLSSIQTWKSNNNNNNNNNKKRSREGMTKIEQDVRFSLYMTSVHTIQK